ncbi:MAG: peptidoglycan-binding domain-containing protein [Candidatus Entotheonellia bacterium]
MKRLRAQLVMCLLVSSFLSACGLSQRGPQPPVAALDRLIPAGLIHVAEDHLKALGFDPGPVDGIFTEQTAEALRQYQRRYGLVVSGLLDSHTREAFSIEKPPEEN